MSSFEDGSAVPKVVATFGRVRIGPTNFMLLTKCNYTSCIHVERSADENQSLRELLYPLRRNQSSTLNRTSVGPISSACIA
jgi:hypothetical protein